MLNSSVVELAIGLTFVILAASLIVSAATEVVASWTRWRAANLEKSLRGMLGGDAQAQLYAHPLIQTLMTPTTKPPIGLQGLFRLPGLRRLWPGSRRPSYIPARLFAFAILDLMERPYQAVEALEAALDQAPADPARVRGAVEALQQLPNASALAPVVDRILPLADALASAPPERMAEVAGAMKQTLAGLTQQASLFDPQLQAALGPLLRAAEGAERMRWEVEKWFDGMMDRCGGWYKRKIQVVQLLVGLALALALDLDLVLIARALWADSALRTSIVGQAETAATEPSNVSMDEARRQLTVLNLPLRGSCAAPSPSVGTTRPWWCDEVERTTKLYKIPRTPWSVRLQTDPIRWLGWLMTALATSLGAPFWFDLLNKVVNLRASGKPPDKRRAQAS